MSCDVRHSDSPRFPSLHLRHSSFSNPSLALPTSTHSRTLPLLHLRHSSFSNPSLALPMSQLILQTFRCFTYVTAHSPTVLSLPLCHRIFTYVTWRAAHGVKNNILYSRRERRLIGISGSLIWSKTLVELIFNPRGEFR